MLGDEIEHFSVPHFWNLAFSDAAALRQFLGTATREQRQTIAWHATNVVEYTAHGRPDVLDVLWEFLGQAEAEGLETAQLRAVFDEVYPGGPAQWRGAATEPSASSSAFSPSTPPPP
jgi:hypothetical protein